LIHSRVECGCSARRGLSIFSTNLAQKHDEFYMTVGKASMIKEVNFSFCDPQTARPV
jgi:hypothetical protein